MCQKKNIWINGQPAEVSDAVFAAYQKGERKMRYFEYDLKVDRAYISYDAAPARRYSPILLFPASCTA